jgi:hypothetical protein
MDELLYRACEAAARHSDALLDLLCHVLLFNNLRHRHQLLWWQCCFCPAVVCAVSDPPAS